NLWQTANLKENPRETVFMKAKCASCHFQDGSDLKYFNFSNESIITRARFHGLSDLQGRHIAAYIRSRNKPNPGRPWNPPFQPGPDLDPLPDDTVTDKARKVRNWMAGAGLKNVISDNSVVLKQVFPKGTSADEIAKVIDHNGNFSVRQISVPYQFPDWNAWLPHYAPEDIWLSDNTPNTLLGNLKTALSAPGAVDNLALQGNLISTFDAFNKGLENWYGQFRLVDADYENNETTKSKQRAPGLTREDAIKGLSHWMVIKIMENVRAYDIEGKSDNINVMRTTKGHPKFTPDSLLMPGNVKLSSVFTLAPHIISNNWSHFVGQPDWLGKMESNQWYHLALCLNSGSRMRANDNMPIDWDYQLIHLQEASERSGIQYGIQNLITQIKMYQSRDNGMGVDVDGFSPRFLTPWKLYSDQFRDRSLFKGALNEAEPDLWRKTYEQFLYEYLDVMESMDLNDTVKVPRRKLVNGVLNPDERHHLEYKEYTPINWGGGDSKFFEHPGEVYADLMFRLLPLLPKEGIDIMLLQDLHAWCKHVWSDNSWNGLNMTASNTLYSQNFEVGTSDFELITTLTNIKDANYKNIETFKPRGGGGAKVAQRSLTAGSLTAPSVRTGTRNATIILPGGTNRLKLRARTAFKDDDGESPGSVKFKMQVRFNNSATLFDTVERDLDGALYGQKFQSYESFLNVPLGATSNERATSINQVVVSWSRSGGAGSGVVYIDNIQIIADNAVVEMPTRPNAPTLAQVVLGNYEDNTEDVTRNSHRESVRIRWNPPAGNILGYNIYRTDIPDALVTTRRKINTGLVDNPYNWFNDYAFAEGANYQYDVTAVNAVKSVDGTENESVKSNSLQLPAGLGSTDLAPPEVPQKIWAKNVTGGVQVGWFPSQDWDVVRYEVLRKRQIETIFTALTITAEAPFYTDTTVSTGITYTYKVIAIDINGNKSPQSAVTNNVTAQ
ncbi:MAG: hypothetical protein NTV80_12640, partial [Verrucomicrobia bacterium]|nr:hypothetical protein [Verrucomicrobiota bacterium]